MAMTDLFFLFFLLPIFLGIYLLLGLHYRSIVLLVLSLFFYACGSIDHFGLLLVSTVINILVGRMLAYLKDKRRVGLMIVTFGVIYNLGVLFYWKYFDFAIKNINVIFHQNYEIKNQLLPLGLSFYTFKAISYLLDVYYGKIERKQNISDVMLYLTFFGQIQSGPLSRYSDLEESIVKERNRDIILQDLIEGVYRFVIGFNKKILIANILSLISNEAFNMPHNKMSMLFAWLGAICYSLELYFDFSGYSDMAIGVSRMFGIRCPENFRYPYATASVSEFWRRWHITLGAWFRDYIYIPMGGSRVSSKLRLVFNLFVVWILTGLWHGDNWTFVVWGLGYFIFISFEKITKLPEKITNKAIKMVYRAVCLFFVMFQWVMFRSADVQSGFSYIKNMLASSSMELANDRALFLIKDNILFIIIAIVLSFPIVPFVQQKVKNYKKIKMIWELIYYIVSIIAFFIAIGFVVSGQNNPFAYANF